MRTLDAQFDEMKSKLTETLNDQKHLCVNVDIWSSRAQSYLGMTIHYIDQINFQRQSYLLAFKQIHGKQSYDELAKHISNIFNDFGSISQRIRNIVTDGGSNICKMFKHFGTSIDAVDVNDGEHEHDEITDEDENDNDEIHFMEDVHGDYFMNEILQLDDPDVVSNGASSDDDAYLLDCHIEKAVPALIKLPPQRRCMSHLLNLLQQDFEKKFIKGSARSVLCLALGKLHALWVLTHRSSQAKSICKEIIGRCLAVPNDTRWNSRPDAVKMVMQDEVQKT